MTQIAKWTDIDMEKLADAVIGRNGKFHIMIAFMGIALMPALVLDRSGRIIYFNKRAEEYWRVKITHVIGRQFSEILNLNERDAAQMARESKTVLAGTEPHVFMECYAKPTPRMSVLKFPFTDDDDDVLLGAFVLPHAL
jgi:PAS domain-containing protein